MWPVEVGIQGAKSPPESRDQNVTNVQSRRRMTGASPDRPQPVGRVGRASDPLLSGWRVSF